MKRYKLLTLCAMGVLSLNAQSLNTEITVDRTVRPTLTASQPLHSVRPSVQQPQFNQDALSLSNFGGDVLFGAVPSGISPFLADGLPVKSLYKGYVTAGYFPLYNLSLQAGYRFVDTESTFVTASVRFNGMSYHARTGLGKGTASENTFGLNGLWLQRLGQHRLAVTMDYSHAAVKTPVADDENFNSIIAAADISRKTDGFGYGATVSIDRLAATNDNTIFKVSLLGSGDVASSGKFEVKADYNHLSRSYYSGVGFFTFTPAYRFAGEHFQGHIGVGLNLAHGVENSKFNMAPYVRIAWLPSGMTSVEFTATGGRRFNTLRSIYEYSPFMSSFCVEQLQRTDCDLGVALRCGGQSGFTAGIAGKYARHKNVQMPMVEVAGIGFVATKLTEAYAKVNLGYGSSFYGLRADVEARVNASGENDGSPDQLDRPKYQLSAAISAQPSEELSVSLDWRFKSGRRCGVYNLNNISDLGFRSTYAVDERLSLAFSVDNILCRRAEIFPGLTAPALTALVSASLKF